VVLCRGHERFYAPLVAGLADGNLVVQPQNRGTAPAILYGAPRPPRPAVGGSQADRDPFMGSTLEELVECGRSEWPPFRWASRWQRRSRCSSRRWRAPFRPPLRTRPGAWCRWPPASACPTRTRFSMCETPGPFPSAVRVIR
jgi:hypothetical protein